MRDPLRVVIRTPHALVEELQARSIRVRTDSGHVGLRPGVEAVVLAVEAGLVLARTDAGMRFIGTAGGLLSCDGRTATLYTPLAVKGDDAAAVQAALDRALSAPDSELTLRTAIDRLEDRIRKQLSAGRQASSAGDEL